MFGNLSTHLYVIRLSLIFHCWILAPSIHSFIHSFVSFLLLVRYFPFDAQSLSVRWIFCYYTPLVLVLCAIRNQQHQYHYHHHSHHQREATAVFVDRLSKDTTIVNDNRYANASASSAHIITSTE